MKKIAPKFLKSLLRYFIAGLSILVLALSSYILSQETYLQKGSDKVFAQEAGSDCQTTSRTYSQCGQDIGRTSGNVYEITELTDCDGQKYYEEPKDFGSSATCQSDGTTGTASVNDGTTGTAFVSDGTTGTAFVSDNTTGTAFVSQCNPELRYSECTWAAPGQVHEVWQDCNGVYSVRNIHKQAGVCGDVAQSAPAPVSSTPSTPPSQCDPQFRYPECTWRVPGEVHEVWQDCNGVYSVRNIHKQAGVCGDVVSVQPQPTQAPVPQQSNIVIAPTPTPTRVPVIVVAPTTTPIPTAIPTVIPTAIPTAVPTITPIPTAIPTVTITPIPTQTPAVGGTVQCPSGFTQTISGSNIICVQQIQNQAQTTTSNAETGPINVTVASNPGVVTQVAGVTMTKELPKTGLPIGAWALTGLMPLGAGLRRFGRSVKSNTTSAHYLWQQREFSK